MSNCIIKTRGRSPPLYVHHNPSTNRYVAGASPIGARVFTSDRAPDFIHQILGNPDTWEIEILENARVVSTEDSRAREVINGLPRLQ
jgi:hypothetical protein